MSQNSLVDQIKEWCLPTIPVYRTPKTVQILLVRQTHDYTVLRTEETREINVAVTPTSASDPKQTTRAVFLASKQKAPETRLFASNIKHYYQKYREDPAFKKEYERALGNLKSALKKPPQNLEQTLEQAILECEIKDRLCRTCPRCTLFGAVVTEQSKIWDRWNIKHRVEYSSAYSLEPYELISETMTFNAVTETTQLTEQALGSTENVTPLANFPSIVSINSPTWQELVLVIKNLLSCKSYGAEGRTKGDVVNYITGIVLANEELITPLEYVLELSERDRKDILQDTYQIVKKYSADAVFQDAVRILEPSELKEFVDAVEKTQIDAGFIAKAYADSLNYAQQINKIVAEKE